MYDLRYFFKPEYAQSHALIVGINAYQQAPPLEYAVNDAEAVRSILVDVFSFPEENVTLLRNESATGDAIRKAYANYEKVGPDDRLIVFFAGHGHTRTGNRGEVGYLVPVDGDHNDSSTLIRWDHLTSNAEFIPAKHIMFLMDACYSGLALKRGPHAGSTRFLKDMMRRLSRQVLTAGKADQVVADSGGPLPNHSVFTGHLIEAFRGNAATEGGMITASAVMAYVYSKVANDKNSDQTPHYGHFDGDGDFVFKAPGLDQEENAQEVGVDRLVSIPFPDEPGFPEKTSSKVQLIRTLLSGDTNSIELHNFMAKEVRQFLAVTSEDNFPAGWPQNGDQLTSTLARYEDAVEDLSILLAHVAYWGRALHLNTLQKCVARSCDRLENNRGLALRWYPILVELYYTGVAAADAQRFDSLASILYTRIPNHDSQSSEGHLVSALADGVLELTRAGLLKMIPGHENYYTPLSEYLFKKLQPSLDDSFFLGKNYESIFDQFEVIFALAAADALLVEGKPFWAPIGRFGWKHYRDENSQLRRFIADGRRMGGDWPPLKAGLFGHDVQRFESVAAQLLEIVGKLNWH